MQSEGPTTEYVESISFEALVVFLREKKVIAVTKACLQRIHYLCTLRHGAPPNALAQREVNARVFLAGFMIAYKPVNVFESMGTLEQALFDVTVPLIRSFERICNAILEGKSFAEVPHELTNGFCSLLFDYLKRFAAWKIPDEAKLLCRIKHALIALYQVASLLLFIFVRGSSSSV